MTNMEMAYLIGLSLAGFLICCWVWLRDKK